MNKSFLSLPAYQRAQKLRGLLNVFANNAKTINAPFSIISYGSSSYRFNPVNHGKFDDLDLFIIINKETEVEKFISTIQMVFLTNISFQKSHLETIVSEEYSICRMYGQVGGIKIGFRIILKSTLALACSMSGTKLPLKNIASIGQSRIIRDKEWSLRYNKYIPIIYRNEFKRLGDEDILVVDQYSLSKKNDRLGAFGRKMLMGTVIFESDDMNIKNLLRGFWEIFVKRSLEFNKKLTPENIVNSIIRSERFSKKFKAKLYDLIKSFNKN